MTAPPAAASPGVEPLPAALRRDPARRRRLGATAIALAVGAPMLWGTDFRPWVLWDGAGLAAMCGFLAGFVPVATDPAFLALLARATLDTLAMATAGTAIAFVLAVPLALGATRALSLPVSVSVSVSRPAVSPSLSIQAGQRLPAVARQAVRLLTTALRAVPEVVWALLLVRALGLGPGAGVLAIGIAYGGLLGKVYSEILESADARPTRALREAGAGRTAALLYALVPGAAQELASYTVYRWECAVRASVVMGFVGAGGLGQLMDQSMKLLNGGEASAILLTFVALVLLADAASAGLRRLLA